jgi:hypothetical protein
MYIEPHTLSKHFISQNFSESFDLALLIRGYESYILALKCPIDGSSYDKMSAISNQMERLVGNVVRRFAASRLLRQFLHTTAGSLQDRHTHFKVIKVVPRKKTDLLATVVESTSI